MEDEIPRPLPGCPGLEDQVVDTPVPVAKVEVPCVPTKKRKPTDGSAMNPVTVAEADGTTYTSGTYAQQFRTATWSTKFTPMHFVSMWKDDFHKDHITVAMSVPSGLLAGGLNGKLFPTVSNDGKELVIKCQWPNVLANLTLMQKGWRRQPGITERQLVTQIMAAECEVSCIRRALGVAYSEPLFSEAMIKLHVECERQIKKVLPLVDTAQGAVLYVILKVRSKGLEINHIDFNNFNLEAIDSDDSDDSSCESLLRPIPGISPPVTHSYDNKSRSGTSVVTGSDRKGNKRSRLAPAGHSDYITF
jgi:hypothetical protein